jgi:hypothetical protein
MQDQHYLLCPGIMEPIESPWKKLFVHADANTFLHMTGLSRPDGKVFFAAINFPESWADGSWTSVFCIMLLGEKVRSQEVLFPGFWKGEREIQTYNW